MLTTFVKNVLKQIHFSLKLVLFNLSPLKATPLPYAERQTGESCLGEPALTTLLYVCIFMCKTYFPSLK